jgi:hypothetical protein
LLCSFQNQFGQWNSYLCILETASFDGDVDELEELIGLLSGKFDCNHATGASETTGCSSTAATGVSALTSGGSTCGNIGGTIITGGTHGSGGAMIGFASL